MKKAPRFPIGTSDFRQLRQEALVYVDKSLFIEQVIDNSARVLLLPRPRRFGKTLNLSMLRYFFEKSKEDRRGLFSGLQIEQLQEVWDHFGKYPVMFLTFKDVKAHSWDHTWEGIALVLSHLYRDHRFLLDSGVLTKEEQAFFLAVLEQKVSSTQGTVALAELSRHLSLFYQEQVVILIDEYDTPIHAAYENGYYQQAIEFFRNFLSGAFKDNSYLYKGVMTGILRVARESLFSGLNNLAVYSLLKPEFSTSFGFTETEVFSLTKQVGHTELMKEIKSWYNGYLFGNTEIYNPWSILHFLASQEKKFQPYWVNTGGNQLLRKLLLEQGLPLKADLETLLKGGSISKPIDENIAFPDLPSSSQAVWSFLLFTGYLKPESTYKENQKLHAVLRLVNHEIVEDFTSLVQVWFERQLSGSMTVEALFQSLFSGEDKQVQKALGKILMYNLSYHDLPAPKNTKLASSANPDEESAPESVYQAFLMGLLVNIQDYYEVKSNRESGYGRADVLVLPKVGGKPGVVMEFKVADKEQKLESALQDAKNQLEQKDYRAELQERGANPIYEYAVAFFRKQVLVEVLSKPLLT